MKRLLPAAMLFAVLPLGAADKLVLRPHWEPGKVHRIEIHTDTEIQMPGMPGDGRQTTTVIQQLDVTVRKEPGTERRLAEMKFSATKAMVSMGDQLLTYDSADPAMSTPALQQAFGALLGRSITLVHDKEDKFVDVIVPEGFTATPLGAGRGPDGKQFADMLRQSVDFGLPAGALAVGETFTQEKRVEMAPLGTLTTRVKGRFESFMTHGGRRHAKLLLEGTLEQPADAAREFALSASKLKAEILFDLERRVVSQQKVETELKMNFGGREAVTKHTQTSTLKSISEAR